MARENVEVVRDAWKAFGEGGTAAIGPYFAEDCICEDLPELPDGGTYHGRDGQLARYDHFVDTWGMWCSIQWSSSTRGPIAWLC